MKKKSSLQLMRKLGLMLFILGMVIFVSMPFIGSYSLSTQSILETFSNKNERVALKLIQIATEDGMLNTSYSNSMAFVLDFAKLLEKYNLQTKEDVAKEKGLTPEEINQIISESILTGQVSYSKEIIESVLADQSQKIKVVNDATNWMYITNKKYDNIDDFKTDFNNKISDINTENAKEFLVYDNKYTRFDITERSAIRIVSENKLLFFFLTFGLGTIGALVFIISGLFLEPQPGIKNNGIFFQSATNRGWVGILVFGFLVSFYILLYFYPFVIANWTNMLDPIKGLFIKNASASNWFLYGMLYCVSMIVMGIRMFIKYRNNKYQVFRTASVLFFQIIFAFLLVEILPLFDLPGVDLKNAWPLDYNFLTDWNVKNYLLAGHLGKFMFFWGVILSLLVVPILTYFFGKRWYCSWICGCGGLAETLGDPFRQLSDKRIVAWKIERFTIYPILIFAIIMTIVVGYNTYNIINAPENIGNSTLFGINAYSINKWYGFLIGSIFAGVIGTGFYPILGNRVWCRFGCPLAAYMGIIQRFKSRFRITTNGGQCISCGNCSVYCEQGIDVRAYAQKGQDVVRASCVGCGICSAVCPRGVLKLENTSEKRKLKASDILLGNNIR